MFARSTSPATMIERDELVRRTGQRTVPQIFIGTRHVGGFEDLSALDQQGELDPLLGLGA